MRDEAEGREATSVVPSLRNSQIEIRARKRRLSAPKRVASRESRRSLMSGDRAGSLARLLRKPPPETAGRIRPLNAIDG